MQTFFLKVLFLSPPSPLLIIIRSSRVEMNGRAALDFGVTISKSEVSIMVNWFWAYRRLKSRENFDEAPPEEISESDLELCRALINGSFGNFIPSGDGKFNRIENNVKAQLENIEMIKKALHGNSNEALAFLLGFEAAFLQMQQRINQIKKG